jgi:hypothetical protein
MSEQEHFSDVDHQEQNGVEPDRTSCGPGHFGAMSCCGETAGEDASGCPCGTMMRKHRWAMFSVFSVLIVAFLVSQVGGILGIIAFARTF